jgi:hypothetical protein
MPRPTAIVRVTTREEAELAGRRRELATVRQALAAREHELERLRDQLFSFEGRYIRQVGVLYRQLEEWEERIAELLVSRESPEDRAEKLHRAQEAAIAAEIDALASEYKLAESQTDAEQEPPLDLKALFRELAKRIHPDFASDHHDERHRTRLMAQANEALRREDAAALRRMLNGHDPSIDLSNPAAIKAELARVSKLIRDVERDTAAATAEMEALAHSEMAKLRDSTLAAALHGRDLLAELAARVKGRIGMAMRRFEMESSPNRRPTPVIDPESLLSAETAAPRKPIGRRFR